MSNESKTCADDYYGKEAIITGPEDNKILHDYKCACDECDKKLENCFLSWDKFYANASIDMPFKPKRQASTIKLVNESKFLDNLQRSKTIEENERRIELEN